MADQTLDLKSIKKQYRDLVIENRLGRPERLKKIIYLKSQGLSNVAIGERLGLDRDTVLNYKIRLRGLESQTRDRVIFWAILLLIGVYFLGEEGKENGK